MISKDDFLVREDLLAAVGRVRALEPEALQLPEKLLLHRDELGLPALHGTGACLATELIKTGCVEVVLAVLALQRVHKNGLAERTEQLWPDAAGLSCYREHLPRVHREAHALEVVVSKHVCHCLS